MGRRRTQSYTGEVMKTVKVIKSDPPETKDMRSSIKPLLIQAMSRRDTAIIINTFRQLFSIPLGVADDR